MPEIGARPEVPRDPKLLALRAFEIHIADIEPLPTGPGLGFETDEKNKKLNADQKMNIDHARRFLKDQPHDRDSAGRGLDLAIEEARKTSGKVRDDPDSAVATEKDLQILRQLRPLGSVRTKIKPYQSRFPKTK